MGVGAVSIPLRYILDVVLQTYQDGHDLLEMSKSELEKSCIQLLVEHPALPEPEIFMGKREENESVVRIMACGGMGTAEVPALRMLECHEAMELLLLDCSSQNCSNKRGNQNGQ